MTEDARIDALLQNTMVPPAQHQGVLDMLNLITRLRSELRSAREKIADLEKKAADEPKKKVAR